MVKLVMPWVVALVVLGACDKKEATSKEEPAPVAAAKDPPAKEPPAKEPPAPPPEPAAAAPDAGAASAAAAEPAAAAPVGFQVGDKVSAKWSDGYWYPAKISKVNDDGTYDVHYDDGTKEKKYPLKKLRPRKVSKGGGGGGGGCSGGKTKCGSRCVDLNNDPNNCSSCGRQCPEACMGGSCVSNSYKYGN